MQNKLFEEAIEKLRNLYSNSDIDQSHDIDHAIAVFNHTKKALDHEVVDEITYQAICLASILHDADDTKFFTNTTNAKNILKELNFENINLVLEMIDAVSTRKNKNNVEDKEGWFYIPRYADRLEAIGQIGIDRAIQYGKSKGEPMFVESAPRPRTKEEIEMIATPERFANYDGNSKSIMDHFYDKLLHIHKMNTNNRYILTEANKRYQIMIDFCLSESSYRYLEK